MLTDGPPAPDEVEVSVFGPSLGECIVVHLGGGDWLIVDSCLDADDEPVALTYLRALGVDPERQVRLLVATHWHDDHIAGLSRVFSACSTTPFAYSAALTHAELLTFIKAFESGASTISLSTGVDESHEIFARLSTHTARPRLQVTENSRLWLRHGAGQTVAAEVWGLAPSTRSIEAGIVRLGRELKLARLQRKRAPALTPNLASIVLWIDIGGIKILLGGDLERAGGPGRGWRQVCGLSARPPGRAGLFKVPHHGSDDAHYGRVWDELLDPQPQAVVTPFQNGAHDLPRDSDIARLCALSCNCYLTGALKRARVRMDKATARALKGIVSEMTELEGRSGHVRLRRRFSGSEWSVDLERPAARLCPR